MRPSRVPVRDAATVILVRDGQSGAAEGLEVFLLARNPDSEFVGGAHVFPGGAVDDDDHVIARAGEVVGRRDTEAAALLGLSEGGLAYWVAAIRECFEEAGLLLARRRGTNAPVDLTDPAVAERFAAHREAVDTGRVSLLEVMRSEDLVLDLSSTYYFAHWITPLGAPRRYDTRFFVTAAPPGQVASPDHREAVDSEWVRPAEALDRFERGEMDLIFPTLKSLEVLRRFDSAASLLSAVRRAGRAPASSRLAEGTHGVRVALPGDEGFDLVPPVDPEVARRA